MKKASTGVKKMKNKVIKVSFPYPPIRSSALQLDGEPMVYGDSEFSLYTEDPPVFSNVVDLQKWKRELFLERT